jgi:uroporphyrinogen-III synthase
MTVSAMKRRPPMPDLAGARIGLLEARMQGELAEMVRRFGGEPVSAPALREDPLPSGDAVGRFIDLLSARSLPFVVFLTGAGASALIGEAQALGREEELLEGLERATTICRGPKPAGVLAKHRVTVDVRVSPPYTTPEILPTLALLLLDDRRVGLVHYGERNAVVVAALESHGATVEELCLYEWQLPADRAPLETLIRRVIAGEIDAVAFTTQIHVRHLLRVADDLGLRHQLLRALTEHTLTAAIGPTCAAALVDAGIEPQVVADPPKIAPMLTSLADRLGQRRTHQQQR